MRTVLVSFISICFAFGTSLAQSTFLTTLESVWGTKVFVCKGDSCRQVYEQDDRAFFNDDIAASPTDRLLCAVSSSRDFIKKETEQPYVDHELLIFSTGGDLLKRIPHVQRYSWSPNGKQLACILGTKYEGFGFAPDSLIVFNTTDWNKHVLNPKVDYQDIYWASFDSMLYATNFRNVYQINPKSGTIIRTDYKGIYISPDGKYYFRANYEGGTFGVYERKTNKDVTPIGYRESPSVNFHRWLPTGSTLVFGDTFKDKQVLNLITKESEAISGQIVGYNEATKEFTVLKHHRFFPEVSDKKIESITIH